jgi:ubiquinone/menaquinone biosynthesis C-methylase UbiE
MRSISKLLLPLHIVILWMTMKSYFGFITVHNAPRFGLVKLFGKGFSSSPSKGMSNGSGISKQARKDETAQLEESIQRSIDSENGLREAMNAFSKTDTSSVDGVGSWSKEGMRKRLLEITWDSSASIRNNRHKSGNEKIAPAVDQHMQDLAKWCLDTTSNSAQPPPSILDVGCGTGVLIKYIQNHKFYNKERVSLSGVDLSFAMIDIARKNYPTCQFHIADFRTFQPTNTFTTVVFNECLHYFSDIYQALDRAMELLTPSSGSRIIISHPRGFDNVFMQHNTNRLLAASLLPSANEVARWIQDKNLKVVVEPDINAPCYLTVLESTVER